MTCGNSYLYHAFSQVASFSRFTFWMPDRVVIKTNSKPEEVVFLLKRLINQKNCYGKKGSAVLKMNISEEKSLILLLILNLISTQ